MKKIFNLTLVSIFCSVLCVGCAIDDDNLKTEDVGMEAGKLIELRENILIDLDIINNYAKSLYSNTGVDSDEYRKCQKNMREYQTIIDDINLNEVKDVYYSENKYEEYRNLVKKYNQVNRSIKYFKGGMSDILADNIVDEDEVFDFICMYNICKYDNALQGDIRDYEGYEEITKEYGFSLIDKQEEFDNEYGVEDIR